MTDEERWASYLEYGQALKATAGTAPAAGGVPGRFITVLVLTLVRFWGRHKATLIPHLAATAIAALEALVSELPNILTVNPPGPT